MAMRSTWILKLLLVVALTGVAACDDETPTSPTTPPAPVTETFSGSVTQNGAQTHSFSTATSGTVTATLREVSLPGGAAAIGFSLGTVSGTACLISLANDGATGGAVLTGTMTGAGNLCVRMYDPGTLAAPSPATYTVEVVHP
jgi:hypothetical protein